jgi:ElaB/YqjD/DUF883 family membrane-anchored ribosome-binding protein
LLWQRPRAKERNNMANIGSRQAKRNRTASKEQQAEPASDLQDLKKNVEDLTSTLGDVASQQYERAQDVAKDTVHQTEETIRRNPFSATLTALGLGFLVGLFKGGPR